MQPRCLVNRLNQTAATSTLLGTSPATRELVAQIENVSATDKNVLIEGPSGSGKSLVGQVLHDASGRAEGPFIFLDCGTISRDLAEFILFGHAAGAFAGAVESREGFLEMANEGTLFLDEVGELPLDTQLQLLHVLETRTVTRVGESGPRPLDVRIVTATWRDLRSMIEAQRFSRDLYFQLAEARVRVPTLAERRADISLLADELLHRAARAAHRELTLSADARACLLAYNYPGNVRELRNVLARAACSCDGNTIGPADLIFDEVFQKANDTEEATMDTLEFPGFKEAKRDVVEDFERQYLERLIARTSGNLAMSAGIAGLERHHLRSLLRKHGISRSRDRVNA